MLRHPVRLGESVDLRDRVQRVVVEDAAQEHTLQTRRTLRALHMLNIDSTTIRIHTTSIALYLHLRL